MTYFLPHDIARCNRDNCLCISNVQGGWIYCHLNRIGTVNLSRKGARILSRRKLNLNRRRNETDTKNNRVTANAVIITPIPPILWG